MVIPVKDKTNKFLVAKKKELLLVKWNGESETINSTEKICEVDNTPDTPTNRFNDGKCDSSGRLWAGTLSFNMKTIPNENSRHLGKL